MRITRVLAACAVLLAAPLAGQDADDAGAPERFSLSVPTADPRLAVPMGFRSASTPARVVEARPRPAFVTLMLIGAGIGCVGGAIIMSSADDVDDREKAPVRFNGCILGASVGMFLGAAYGWASGARMP
jgi:hypothetical protein